MFQSGRFAGKMVVFECLDGRGRYPWQAAWYDDLVHEVQGPEADERFGLWMVDNAMHMNPTGVPGDQRPVRTTHIVAWVEHGLPAPASTSYDVVDGQVSVPARAADRKGIQPTVEVTADGGARTEVAAGAEVTFSALIEVPPGTGTVVAAEWDFDGSGEYATKDESIDGASSRLNVTARHTFDEPGT